MDGSENISSIESVEISEIPEVDVSVSEGYTDIEDYEDCEFGTELSAESTDIPQEDIENYDDCNIEDTEKVETANFDESDNSNNEYSFDDCEKMATHYEIEPFDEEGNLKANIEYTTGEYDYRYTTDEKGRIDSFRTDELHLTERDNRLPHDGNTFDKDETDDAGHLIGDRFGGSPNLDNLVSQDSHINRSEYKIMENEWASAVEEGHRVQVAGDVNYEGDTKRPSSFDVYYSIDDDIYEKLFINRRE